MKQKVNVLFLAENFFPLSTPSAQRAFAYAKTLALHSHGTVIITKSPVSFKSDKITVMGLNLKKEIPIFDPFALFLYFVKSIRIIRKYSITLIISTVPKINNAIAGFLLSKIFKIPHVIDVRDYWESPILFYPLTRIVPRHLSLSLIMITSLPYRKADLLITVNETLRKILIERRIPRDRIHVIPNGVDTSLFRPCENKRCIKRLRKKYALPLQKVIFVYGGSLASHNRLDAVLEGIGYLKQKRDLVFLIIGRPTLLVTKRKISQMVEKLELKRHVRLMEALPVAEAAELFRCCDVGVIPLDDQKILRSMTTAKVFAYLASGIPVLASGPKDGELEKLLNKHRVGLFIEKTTPQGFTKGFRNFLQEKPKIRSIGLKGRKIMEEYYDRYALAQKIVPVVDRVINAYYPQKKK